jgi:hypothetical protein
VKVDFFILADAASAAEGKLYLHGGAITRLNLASLPAAVTLAGAVRLLVDESDPTKPPQRFGVEWHRPDGTLLGPALEAETPPEPQQEGLREGEERGLLVILTFALVIDAYGPHEVRVTLDGEHAAERRLLVTPGEA